MKPFSIFLTTGLVFIAAGFLLYGSNSQAPQLKVAASEVNFEICSYANFSDINLQTARQQKQKTVLFFAASGWCQSCSYLENELQARKPEIPADTTVLRVNYDSDIQTNQKYSVTSQHTLVVLDSNGQELSRWVGGDFDHFLEKLKGI